MGGGGVASRTIGDRSQDGTFFHFFCFVVLFALGAAAIVAVPLTGASFTQFLQLLSVLL